MNFENKVVLVTGANRGLGKEIVKSLLLKGVKKIYAGSRSLSKLPNFEDQRVIGLELDITNQTHITKASTIAKDCQILINNAGFASYTSLLDGPMELMKKDMDINYYGTLNMIREFVAILEKNENPVIANVITIAAFVNFPAMGGYCASKSAAFSMTQGIRIELSKRGIQVHSINPGPIDTDMAAGFEADKTSAKLIALNLIEAMEKEQQDIFPDPNGQYMFDLYQKNHQDLEKMVHQIHHS
ncbi:SDR family oxidoreductase [bacterium]|nr:SDR family oxidoreductase [bacterium]